MSFCLGNFCPTKPTEPKPEWLNRAGLSVEHKQVLGESQHLQTTGHQRCVYEQERVTDAQKASMMLRVIG
jgi:hypothetical protein